MPTSPLIRWGRGSLLACPSDAIWHATCVALAGRGVLITGASGRGKSALALQLMALGAQLVADDRCLLQRDGTSLVARAPDPIRGLIEARGIGILRVVPVDRAAIALIVDLDQTETTRLPPPRSRDMLGLTLPLLHNVAQPYFPAAILAYITHMQPAESA